MKSLPLIILLFLSGSLPGQQLISLEMCIDSAIANHPRSGDSEILRNINLNKSDNISSNWYPELSLNGQITYQSDVVELKIDSPFPGFEFPVVPKDQYKAFIDVNQTIYDAGMTKKLREKEALNLEASLIETENDIEEIKSVVVNLYFRILMLQESINILEITSDHIEENIEIAKAGVENGIALSSDVELMQVELLEQAQQIQNLDRQRQATVAMLVSVCRIDIRKQDYFRNSNQVIRDSVLNRKELDLLKQNRKILEMSSEIAESSRLPVAFAFGQVGYGNPGLNMFNDNFDSYYLVGVGLKWNIWDWNHAKREKTNILYSSDLLLNKENELKESIYRAKENQKAEIVNHRANIENYSDILAIREKITKTYQEKYREGLIRAVDLLNVTNQEEIIRIKLNNEKILLQKSIADLNLITGNF